jgi:REP element-mobilizing transposase RayT
MPLFWKPYKSDVTQFIDSLKRQGRLLLWDKAQDRQAQQGFNEGRVEQQPYVYQTKG